MAHAVLGLTLLPLTAFTAETLLTIRAVSISSLLPSAPHLTIPPALSAILTLICACAVCSCAAHVLWLSSFHNFISMDNSISPLATSWAIPNFWLLIIVGTMSCPALTLVSKREETVAGIFSNCKAFFFGLSPLPIWFV